MHPVAFQSYVDIKRRNPNHWALKFMVEAQHFFVGEALHDLAAQTAKHEAGIGEPEDLCALPVSSRLPGEKVCLTVEGDGAHAVVLLWKKPEEDFVRYHHIMGDYVIGVTRFWPGTPNMGQFSVGDSTEERFSRAISQNKAGAMTGRLCFILSLVNAPRKIIHRQQSVPRQQRRAMERAIGSAVGSFITVGWEIGKAVVARQSASHTGHRNALHWRRAHWSLAKQGEPKAEFINDVSQNMFGWYRWVSECWAGDPAFGVRLHRYEPRAPGEKKRLGAEIPSFGPTGEKLAFVNAATRASISAAGYN